jgi:hypothetical protein
MHPVNILRIFAFSLVIRRSNANNTLFNSFGFFQDTLYRWYPTILGGLKHKENFAMLDEIRLLQTRNIVCKIHPTWR